MRALIELFTSHPASVGETYLQHMMSALSYAGSMAGAAFAIFLHAFFPFLFVKTGSKTISRLYDCMILHRSRVAPRDNATQ